MMITPPMTDTPLTDALARMELQAEKINNRFVYNGTAIEVVSADFSRTLERALSEEKEKVRELANLLRECLPRVGLIVITTDPPMDISQDDLRERIDALLTRLKGE